MPETTKKTPMRIMDERGQRLYLTREEVKAFLKAADNMYPKQRTLCYFYAETGVRAQEAINLKNGDIDVDGRTVRIKTLKQRRDKYRHVPVSPQLLDMIAMVHQFRYAKKDGYIWHTDAYQDDPINVRTANRWVTKAMVSAGIKDGPHRCVRGLRHYFGVHQVTYAKAPLNQVQVWMGHTSMDTTAIYATASGDEQLAIADRYFSMLYAV